MMEEESCTSDIQRAASLVELEGEIKSAVNFTDVEIPVQIKISNEPYNGAKILDDIVDTVGTKANTDSLKELPVVDKEELKPPSESQKHQLRKKTYLNLDTTSSHFKTSIFDEEDRTFNSSNDPDKSAAKMYKCITSPPLPFSPPSTPFPFSPPSISSPVSGVAFSAKSYRNESEKINVLKAFEIALALSYDDDESVQNEEFSKEALLDEIEVEMTADPDVQLLDAILLDATADLNPDFDNAAEGTSIEINVCKISEDDIISFKSSSIIDELNEKTDVLSTKGNLEVNSSSVDLISSGKVISLESVPMSETEHLTEGELRTDKELKFEEESVSIGVELPTDKSLPKLRKIISEKCNFTMNSIQDSRDDLLMPVTGTEDISSFCESQQNVENVSSAESGSVPEKNDEIQNSVHVPEIFVSTFSFSSKSPFGYSKSVIWTAVDADSVSSRIKKSRSSYLGGGACGLATAKLKDAGYQEHVGMWRGWPYDNWTCCNSRSMICPAALVTSSTSSKSDRIDRKCSADDGSNRRFSRRPHRCDVPSDAVRGSSDSIRSWSALKSNSDSVKVSSRSSSASALPRRSQSAPSASRQKNIPVSISSSTVKKNKVISPSSAAAIIRKSSSVSTESSSTISRGNASRLNRTDGLDTSSTANIRSRKLSKTLPADFVNSSFSSKYQTTAGSLPPNENINRHSTSIKNSSMIHNYVSSHKDVASSNKIEKEVRK